MRIHFDEQLNRLNEEMIHMGGLVELAIENACKLMVSRDRDAALALVESDSVVDRKEREIESLCLRLILMQQPVARDLRLVSSALKMITDMERIGDQAADIAEIISMPVEGELYVYPGDLQKMGQAAVGMVRKSVDAFVQRDVKLAKEVIKSDDIVDQYFVEVKEELLESMISRPAFGAQLMDALMIAKYMERIGDHAVNIAGWVEYAVTGIHKGVRL